MTRPGVYLTGLATVVPERSYTQDFCLEYLLGSLTLDPARAAFLKRIYAGAGIERRHAVVDYTAQGPHRFETLSTAARNDVFIAESNKLSLIVAGKLLPDERARCRVTHLVTASCTGGASPGFTAHLIRELRLPPSVEHFHLGFMGCAAAFPALKTAAHICRAAAESVVLVVCLELCSLHLKAATDADSLVASAIFADGCGAALVSGQPDPQAGALLEIEGFHSRFLPDFTDDLMWKLGDFGFDIRLSAAIPAILAKGVAPVMNGLLAAHGVGREKIDAWAVHPGGKKILDRLETGLALAPGDLDASRAVLRDYGNMSSATIFFVLDRLLKDGRAGTVFAAAFGPGLTIETALLSGAVR